MATVTPGDQPQQPASDSRAAVAKAALPGGAAFVSAIATILVVGGAWEIDSFTVRYALTVVGVIAAFAFLVLALSIGRRE